MEISAFASLVIPFIVIVYIIVVTFLHLPKAVIIASLAGGLIMGVINALFDLLAYYAHWWHYTLNGLILHLPIPFYITPILVYGGIGYLVIWRLWRGRYHWLALLLLCGIPLFRAGADILGAFQHTGYVTFDSTLAAPLDVIMWLLMFFAGYGVFRLLAPRRESIVTA